MLANYKVGNSQAGFSLVELMVGLVIGLMATLVIMQTFSNFEGQKRTTTGSADAQTNGSIALFTMQRDIQSSGFGLSLFDTQNPPLLCADASMSVNHDGDASTANVGMFPIAITDGGAGSDTIRVRYSVDGATSNGGIAIKVVGATGNTVSVDTNLGCNDDDVVLISSGSSCAMTTINDADLTDNVNITLDSAVGAVSGASLSCMGQWNEITYAVANNQLLRNDATTTALTPIVSQIVNIQAQYGVSATADSNVITNWVNATAGGIWETPTVANRNRIKAVRVAVVAMNGLLEKASVTAAAPLAWTPLNGSTAPIINLTAIPNWQQYRYRVYETVIPLRNMLWSKNTL